MTTTTTTRYQISTRKTPGAAMTIVGTASTLQGARKIARDYDSRRDLTHQDVRIETADGVLKEYAGPSR